MTAPESNGQIVEQKSSVELVRNAKGDCQPRVKLYEGVSEEEVERLQALAVATYRELERELCGFVAQAAAS